MKYQSERGGDRISLNDPGIVFKLKNGERR
jgi:hypothetical protein